MTPDSRDDRALCEWMAAFITADLVREINASDEWMHQPWGGLFERPTVNVSSSIGEC